MAIQIPKLAFTYWSGNTLTYLHILTLRSITSLNPNLEVIVYTTAEEAATDFIPYSSHEHKVEISQKIPFSALYKIPNIKIVSIDFEKEYGVTETLFHSYLADILRIKKLEEHGGLWFDMDVLFVKPFPDTLFELQKNKQVKLCSYSNTIATGFILSIPNSEITKEASVLTDEYLHKKEQTNFEEPGSYKDYYQAFGPDLWRKVLHPHLDNRVNRHPTATALSVKVVYPYLFNEMDNFFLGLGNTEITHETLGIHWYNGSTEARNFINSGLEKIDLESPKTHIEQVFRQLQDQTDVDLSVPQISDYTTSLRGANLRGSNLQNANLQNADLRDSNLQNANLRNADLRNADLRGANLHNANLDGANLTNAILEGFNVPKMEFKTLKQEPSYVPVNSLGISVVIAYFNRKEQLLHTLKTFQESKHENFEVIIVDDISDKDQSVETVVVLDSYDFEIKIITLEPHEKSWINPCMAYNIGIRYASKEVVMLQNAEVCHVGDVLDFTAKNIQPNDWLTFNCYGLNKTQTNTTYQENNLSYDFVKKLPQNIGGNSVATDDPSGWLNHFDKHFTAYHYCGAIFKEDLFRKLNGGFSEEFANLVGGDDDNFVKRLIHQKFNFKIQKFEIGNPFVVHLHHEKTNHVKNWNPAIYEKTKITLAKSLLAMGFAPENNIAIAPKTEIPMARRILL